MPKFALRVVSVERSLYEGDVEFLVANGAGGELGVLAHHAPLMTILKPGPLRIQESIGGPEEVLFGRLAAKVPARRAGQAVARLIELYSAEKLEAESPDDFFARVPLSRVSSLLADLEQMDEATATPDDFVDLGETKAFEVVLQEGECAA